MPNVPHFEDVARGICHEKQFANPSFIGGGAFKEAYATKTQQNLTVAIKLFNPTKCNLCRADREIAAMQQCQSESIAKLYEWGTYDKSGTGTFLYIVEEYLSGGTLADRLAKNAPSTIQVCDYGLALMDSISHMRGKALVHRDIKPENIMFRSTDNAAVLVDFGLVRDLAGVSLTHSYLPQGPGTPFFSSPEQLNNDKFLIDWRSDQFSTGIVLGICLTGSHPHHQPGQTDVQTVERIMSRAICSHDFSQKVAALGFGFLTKMLSPWPVDRFAHPDLIINALNTTKEGIS